MPASRRLRFGSRLFRYIVSLALALAAIPVVDARLAPPHTAWAANYTVNLGVDGGDGTCDGTCTLRDAILNANSSGGADTIVFSVSGPIVLLSALPAITDTLTIDGSGPGMVTVDGANAFRVFSATAPLTLTALTVQRGNSGHGGGAYFGGMATVSGTTFISNTAFGFGGGAYFGGTAAVTGTTFISNTANYTFPDGGYGGGAYFVDTVTVVSTNFISNTASGFVGSGASHGGGGGAYFADTATVISTNFISNTASGTTRGGGGAWFDSAAAVTGTTFISNTASNYKGGGARFDSIAALTGTTFIRNAARSGGGAWFDSSAAVTGTTFISNTASSLDGGGGAYFVDTAAVTGTTFISNTATGSGGGAKFEYPAAVAGTTFISNRASFGGGGGASFRGPATVTGTTFISNTATGGGGASFVGPAAVTGTTFISNTASTTGGGAFVAGPDSVFEHSLFQANVAGSTGGGIQAEFASNLRLDANRIVDNQAGTQGGGLHLYNTDANLDNNIVAANRALPANGVVEISLAGSAARLTGRHNTLAWGALGSGMALSAETSGQTVALTNTIFHGYAVGVNVAPSAPNVNVTLDGVLWSGVTSPAQGPPITVTHAYTGSAAFANPAARDYHLTPASTALDNGVPTSLSVDFEGDARPFGPAPDLGADERLPAAPVAVDDTATTPEDTPKLLSVLVNDSIGESGPLTVSAVGPPSSGAVAISGGTQIAYTPTLNFTGPAVFTYSVTDGTFTDTAIVTVTVTPVNDAPSISNVGDLTITVNSSTGPIGFTINDVESGGGLTVTGSSNNATLAPNGSIVLGGSGTSRTVTITPAAGQSGQATITLTVSDGNGGTVQDSFGLTVVDTGNKLFLPLLQH